MMERVAVAVVAMSVAVSLVAVVVDDDDGLSSETRKNSVARRWTVSHL